MAPTTFSLVCLLADKSDAFIASVESLALSDRPHWIGQCHHWIHQPQLSTTHLNGLGPKVQKWDYLLITTASPLPEILNSHIAQTWSITAEVTDDQLSSYATASANRSSRPTPQLPKGWSATDPSGLDAATPPPDVSASLAQSAPQMNADPQHTPPLPLKSFIRGFPMPDEPIAMFNLLSYRPGKRETYFRYIAAFTEFVGSTYGGEAIFLGLGVQGWSSREDEEREKKDGGKMEEGEKEGWSWDDTALIWYPSIWHFGKMLDDDNYIEADRAYKTGVLRDNPILCCTEKKLVYRE